MSVVVNAVRPSSYMDSVALMRCSREIAARDSIEDAALMMGTPANLRVMDEAGILNEEGRAASACDLIIAVRAADKAAAETALAAAVAFLGRPARPQPDATAWQPKTLRAGLKTMPEANLALISTPGDYAAAEARKALNRGLHVMIFSDNVSIQEEIALKQQGRETGLLVMGPDCGTAIIAGVPLCFANKVPRGKIGLIGASGTGIQEATCQIAKLGHGVSHAIGVGGRDLKAEVGGTATLMALDMLDADPETQHIILVSKPPASTVAARIMARIEASPKPMTICFVGDMASTPAATKGTASTIRDAARLAVGLDPLDDQIDLMADSEQPSGERSEIRGLFVGGTLCAEAQAIMQRAGLKVASNVPVPGASMLDDELTGHHQLIDLGHDQYTQGRPHPMINPSVRDQALAEALEAPEVGVVLLDVVLGFGSHPDPAGHLAGFLEHHAADGRLIVASVTGTDDDPQNRRDQVDKLERVGVKIAPSNADAVAKALTCLRSRP